MQHVPWLTKLLADQTYVADTFILYYAGSCCHHTSCLSLCPQGSLSEVWAPVVKAAIAEGIVALTKLPEEKRSVDQLIKTPTVMTQLPPWPSG